MRSLEHTNITIETKLYLLQRKWDQLLEGGVDMPYQGIKIKR